MRAIVLVGRREIGRRSDSRFPTGSTFGRGFFLIAEATDRDWLVTIMCKVGR